MRTFFTSLLSAILGALLVYGAFTLAPPADNRSRPETTKVKPVANQVPANTGDLTPQEIYERYGDAVVHVKASVTNNYENFFGLPIPDNQVSSGSGFIVSDDGYVITNAHVVSGADKITVQFSDNAEEEATLVGADQSTDLAVLKTNSKPHKAGILALGDSQNLKVGHTVYAIGNPLGYDRSMSSGIVSALNRVINAPNGLEIRGVIQTDAAVNRGNSGGPLLSSRGKVIGVTSQIATTGEGSIGIAFAIPSATVKKIFEELKSTGKTSRPWIGVQGTTINAPLAQALDLEVNSGALIVSIIDPGPARDAGLRASDRRVLVEGQYFDVGGDIITKLNKAPVNSMEDLVNETNQYRPGEKLTLTVLRDGKFKKIPLTLTERPAKFEEPSLRR